MTRDDITYIPNIVPITQEYSYEKTSNNRLKKVFYLFFLIMNVCFSSNNIYPHLDDPVYLFDSTCIDSFLFFLAKCIVCIHNA
jgi:hypothetical protein